MLPKEWTRSIRNAPVHNPNLLCDTSAGQHDMQIASRKSFPAAAVISLEQLSLAVRAEHLSWYAVGKSLAVNVS